jgi:putative transposase
MEVEVTPDHIHLLVGCGSQFGIHWLVKLLKRLPHTPREEHPGLKRWPPSLWTSSNFVATTGGVTLETLKRYVQGQKGK